MKNKNILTYKWDVKAKAILQGRKIIEARYMTDNEMRQQGWHQRSVVFVLDNGTICLLSRDDEGNGPGSMFYIMKDHKGGELPVI